MITQYYSQGGKSTSAFMTDYVELYNNGTSEIDLTTGNWTIQFQNGPGTGGGATGFATNTSYYLGGPSFTYYTRPLDSATNGFNGHLKPGQFLLIQIPGTNSGGGLARLENTIVPDISITTSTLTVAGTANSSLWTTTSGTTISQAGQIAVANSTTPVTCTANNPTNAVDFAGWGTAVCYEGTAAAGVLANNGRYLRAYWRGGSSGSSTGAQTGQGSNICTNQFDTDVNYSDFQPVAIGTSANTYDTKFQLHSSANVLTISASGAYNTPLPYNPILCGTATATPNPVSQGGEFTVSVAVKATDLSVGPYTVTADLSGITGGGLSNATPLNGSGATLTSDTQTILASVAQAPYNLTFTGQDSNGVTLIIPSIKLTVGPKPDVDIQCNGGRDTAFTKAKTFTNATYQTGTQTAVSCTLTTPPTYTPQKADGSAPDYVTVGGTQYLAVDSYRVVCSGAASSDCNIVGYPINQGTIGVNNNYFSITPLGGSVSMKCGSSGTATYTGSPIACTLSFSPSVTDVSPANPFSCDPITYYGNAPTVYAASTTPPTNQGSYTATELGGCYSSDSNYTMSLPTDTTFTITQGTPVVKGNCADANYDGTPKACVGMQANTSNSSGVAVSGTFAFIYTGVTDPSYGPTANPPTAIGDYSVLATFTPTDTLNWASGAQGTGTFSIVNPTTPVTITATSMSMNFGDSLPTFTASTSPSVAFATPPTCGLSNGPVTNAGAYTIHCSGGSLADPAYAISSYVDGTLTVNPMAAGLVVLGKSVLNFPDTPNGGISGSQIVALYNNSAAAITASPVVTGADFSLTNNSCTGMIAAGGQCYFWVHFTPKSVATGISGTLTVNYSGGPAPLTVALNGNGIMRLTLSTTSMTFAPLVLGQPSSSQMVTVYNPTGATINVVSPVVSGADFMLSNSTCTGALASKAACNVWVRTMPKSVGTTSGTLTISADGVPAGTVTLSGTGIAGPITLNKTMMVFAPLAVGQGSSSQMVTLYNNSGAGITVTPSIDVADFIISANGCTGTVAAGGTQCNMWVRFTPKSVSDTLSGTLTVRANGNVIGTVSLAGVGQ